MSEQVKKKPILKRIILISTLLLIIIIAILFTVVLLALRSPFPKVKGKIEVSGLKDRVNIYRDDYGIPHIYANNSEDMLFGQGYVHGQDRFWQMESARRLAQGRLSEVIGPMALDSDKYMRKLGIHKIARRLLEVYEKEEPWTMQNLLSYTAGINSYLETNKKSLSFSQFVFNLKGSWEVTPWTTYDTVAYSVLMSWFFGGSFETEKNNSLFYSTIDQTIIDYILPSYQENRPFIFEQAEKKDNNNILTKALPDSFHQPAISEAGALSYLQAGVTPPLNPNGSNGWIVSGKHTETGKPILANDAHLWLTMPSYWYLMSLHSPEYKVTGFSFPGGPGIIIGRNANVTWGITNSVADVQDLYRLRINPDNPREYEYNGQWRKFIVEKEIIKVFGSEDVILEIYNSHYGPVVAEDSEKTGEVLALRWEGYEQNSKMFKAILEMNKAVNHTEFRQALSQWGSPSICFLYADTDNNIGIQLVGNIPKRNFSSTRVPLPGWNNDYAWQGFYPFETLPFLINPESGYIVAANNSFNSNENPPVFITVPGNRAQRIVDLLEKKIKANEKITPEYCSNMQMDAYSLLAREYVELIKNLTTQDDKINRTILELTNWDCQLKADSTEATIFSLFTYMLVNNIYKNNLSEEVFELYKNSYNLTIFTSLHLLARNKNHPLWDNPKTPAKEKQEDILIKSLVDAVDWLKKELGPDSTKWEWGKLHTLYFKAAPLGMSGIKPLENLVNRGPYPVDGDVNTLNNHDWYFHTIANVGMHPSMRYISDINDLNGNQGILAVGQSDHVTHKNYDNMIPLWLQGEELPMPLTKKIIQTYANHLELLPVK